MTGEHIVNLLQCRAGEHPLFRSYGLGGEVDGMPITRGQVQVEAARWYPGTVVRSVVVDKVSPEGHYVYSVSVEGR